MNIRIILLISIVIISMRVNAEDVKAVIPLHDRGTSTYYVNAQINGHVLQEFMLDTGSAYVVIDKKTLKLLNEKGNVEYLKDLTGKLADGSQTSVPLYRVDAIRVGQCVIRDVEVAVFPNAGRSILGLSAIRKVAPVEISIEPPSLRLSKCPSDETGAVAVATPPSREEVMDRNATGPGRGYIEYSAFSLTGSTP